MNEENKLNTYILKLRVAVEYGIHNVDRIEDVINELAAMVCALTQSFYDHFSIFMKDCSDGNWKKWIRNQMEGLFLTPEKGRL